MPSTPAAPRRLGRPPKASGPGSRSLILDAALELFAAQGYEATSVREIAAKLGFRDSALYGHFSSKAAIRDELLQMYGPVARRLEWAHLDLADAVAEPQAFVRRVLHDLVKRWLDPKEQRFLRFLLTEQWSLSGEPVVRLTDLQKSLRQALADLAAKLMANGVLRETDPAWLVDQFVAPILMLRTDILFSQEVPEAAAIQRRIDRHIDLFFQMFRQPSKPPTSARKGIDR